ncbi:outer membrane protein transport protein (OMPP1/FadL/TodX) [mine drainage metagenome]|uniref:Outer membrane protein transport protein (OMPP1/FadL/TodX) n=1 Tax=mine drainage metagenome TaxID=410659 RepID=A0A1J5TLD8_9ZZZZ
MRIKKIVASLFSLGMVASPLANATNGYFPIGYGAQNEGMGGASIALPMDSLAAANNPAGMVMVGDRVDVGLTFFKPNRSAEISGNTLPGPTAPAPYTTPGTTMNGTYDGNGKSMFYIPSFGYNKMINSDTSLGVSVFGNGGMNTQYDTNPFASLGGQGPAGINLEQLFIAPTWSQKINANNSVGVSLNLAYQMFSATGLQPFEGMSQTPTAVTNNGTDTSTGYGLRFGWTGQVTPMVTLGATYQTKTKMSKFSKYSGLFADQGSFDIPSNYGLGAAVKATSQTTVAFDVVRINYSGVGSVGNAFTSLPPAFGGTGLQLGATGGPGFGWQDMTVVKLGVSYDVDSTLTVRAGYNHNNQQIPSNQTLLNIMAPGVVQNHLSLGSTWKLANKQEVTFAYIHAFKQTVTGVGVIPAALGGGNASISMSEDSLSLSYGWY